MERFRALFLLFNVFLVQIVLTHSTSPEHCSIAPGNNCIDDPDYRTPRVKEKSAVTNDYSLPIGTSHTPNVKKDGIPWYLKVPLLPMLFATSPTLPNGECKRQVQKYLEELDKGTRCTPSYFVVIMFTVLVLPHLGSGPFWESKIGLESKTCADNWWTNILYINNYINTDKMCMFQSWYITVDFHLYIMALFVIYFFWKMPRKIGYPFLIVIVTIGSFITFYSSYFYNVVPVYRVLPVMRDVREDPQYIGHYIKTHERLSTYFLGVIGGAIIYDHSLSPWSIPKPWKHLPVIFGAILLSITVEIMGSKYYDPNVIPTPMENALYASLSRLSLAVVVVVVIVYISVSDRSEICHKIFKPRWVQPLAKLTYGAYLVHHIHQSYDIATVRNARTCSVYNAIRDIVIDVVFSFSVAFLLAMVIEGPFRKIEKRLMTRRSDESISPNTKDMMEKSE